MRGCLSLPFRLAFLAAMALAAYVAWSYRGEIRRKVHDWTAESGPPPSAGKGNPARAADVRRALEALRPGGRDSVVLSAGDVASLLAAAAAEVAPGAIDSVEVRLGNDDVDVRGVIDSRKVPLPLGPLKGVVRDREPIEIGGRVLFRRTELLEWKVERVRVRGIPLPREVVDGLLGRFAGQVEGGVIPLRIPRNVSGLRVTGGGVTFYGGASGGRPR